VVIWSLNHTSLTHPGHVLYEPRNYYRINQVGWLIKHQILENPEILTARQSPEIIYVRFYCADLFTILGLQLHLVCAIRECALISLCIRPN
jgi:hypothetical protein